MTKPIITTEELKRAAKKGDFRSQFPELRGEFDDFISKGGCAHCAKKMIEGLMQYEDRLFEYFGDVILAIDPPESFDPVGDNNFTVINCGVHELEDKLNALPPAAYQITAARYEDKVTVVINRLD